MGRESKNIGFVSTRFCGTDGVSLESAKWAKILWDYRHVSYWFAGQLDRNRDISVLSRLAFFDHEEIRWINERIFGSKKRSREVTGKIHTLRHYLKERLYRFLEKFKIDILIPQNCLTIPLNIPLGLALTEIIAETGLPSIAHHHDFYWERSRFKVNSVQDYLNMAFPPDLPNIQHVVINSTAQEDLAWRTGISAFVIPNVLDFENPPQVDREYTAGLRKEIGLEDEDQIILQPTRIVQRKGIEHAIELVRRLGDRRYKLVITHQVGDEGHGYAKWLQEEAENRGVELRLISHVVAERKGWNEEGKKNYALWDIYPHADLVTYPSLYEGFGNAFIEAVYFRKPLLVNRYSTFVRDIEPQGFDLIAMDGFITDREVDAVKEVLEDGERKGRMVEHNYQVAARHYSFAVLKRRLGFLLGNFFGIEL